MGIRITYKDKSNKVKQVDCYAIIDNMVDVMKMLDGLGIPYQLSELKHTGGMDHDEIPFTELVPNIFAEM
jgi:hypothetical protein